MEMQLYKWFLAQRERNMPVSGDMIKQRALSLCTSLSVTNFKASDGWLQRFKKRYGVRFLKITGEKLSSQPELINPFKARLSEVIQEYDLNEHQLYNADETGLYWQLLPDKTYVSLAEKTAPGLKIVKKRITFLGCANASGLHKIKPLVIGKAKNPRCFKNFNNPLIYRNSKNAWMTAELFKNCFFQQFVPEVKTFLRTQKLPEQAVLLLDNAPSHPSADELKTSDGKIFVMFMPPNVTPLIQPMDQNILRLTKLFYRNSLLASIIPGSDAVGETLKKVTLKDAVLHLAAAWEKISPQVIEKCWHNIMADTKQKPEDEEDEDDLPLSVLQQRLKDKSTETTLGETITLLKAIAPATYTADDVEEWNKDVIIEDTDLAADENGNESDESECEIQELPNTRVTHSEAVKALSVAIDWAKQNNLNISEIIILKNICEKAVLTNISAKQTQSKITSYFSRKT